MVRFGRYYRNGLVTFAEANIGNGFLSQWRNVVHGKKHPPLNKGADISYIGTDKIWFLRCKSIRRKIVYAVPDLLRLPLIVPFSYGFREISSAWTAKQKFAHKVTIDSLLGKLRYFPPVPNKWTSKP